MRGAWRRPAGRVLALAAASWTASACGPAPPRARAVPVEDGWEFRRAPTASERRWGEAPFPVDTAWRPARVPGTVHTDLLAAGLIPDPFDGDNEVRLQWVGDAAWEYRTTLPVGPELSVHRNLTLVLDGLDTYADVRLDGDTLLAADNMFRRWEVPLDRRRTDAPGLLEIRFRPAVAEVLPTVRSNPVTLPMGNDRGEPPTRAFTRKAAYHFGWDWGPRFVTAGVWRPVTLRAWEGARIADVRVAQDTVTDSLAVVTAWVELRADTTLEVRLRASARPVGARGAAEDGVVTTARTLRPGLDTVPLTLRIPRPRRWWPNGRGPQNLYALRVELGGAARDARVERIGLRTVEVVTEPDPVGETFHVRVNGEPVFMKGANWVPADHFSPRVGAADLRRLLEAARDAHVNMLRVWGGGIYEKDAFYALADEMGILVWQDFMFANQMVPGDSAFVASVAAEAADQVRRLRNHPSLALWCGNNEMAEGWANWGWQEAYGYSAEDSARVWRDYERIFHDVLPSAVSRHDPGRFYWPSSPRHGWGRPESLTEGDAHYWGVWWGMEPFAVFRRKLPRFMSEFGFQGMPDLATVRSFTRPPDRRVDSPVMAAHQKHPTGFETIRAYMERWWPVPPPDSLAAFTYLSQLLQAEGMRTAFEAHRRARPRTMGTLYWQLDDTWPVVSWSSIDHAGRWKALHHAARRAFAPVLVSAVVEDGDVAVWVVNDRRRPLRGTVEVAVHRVEGGPAVRWTADAVVPAGASRPVWRASLDSVAAGADPAELVLVASVTDPEADPDEPAV
ncbi:MAG: glycoside hydrolase family 2 protein, partial [Gemmatimonadota bacterium]